MMILLVNVQVKDYDAWKPVFDQGEELRAEYGCHGHTIFRDADKPNDLVIAFEYESRERGDAIRADPRLREQWRLSGVIGQPQPRWMERTAQTAYVAWKAA